MLSQLLEDHLKQLREEDGVLSDGGDDGDEESAWNGWDVESDTSSESSDGWIDVESEGEEDLDISDSEDEYEKSKVEQVKADEPGASDNVDGDRPSRISSLATTKVRFQRVIVF